MKNNIEETKSSGCTKCGCPSDIAHYEGCPELGIKLHLNSAELLKFEKDGKKSYFDYKDGKWQFWGDLEIDESAKLLFETLSSFLAEKTKQEITKALEEQKKEIIELAEKIIQEERFSGTPNAMNKLIEDIKNNIK